MQNSDPFAARDDRPDDSTPARDDRPDAADSVLAAFEDALSGDRDHGRLLAQWSKRFPAYAADLAFVVSSFAERSAMDAQSGEDIPESLIERLVADAVIPAVKSVSADLSAESVSLEAQAQRSGVAFPERLAELLRVSPFFLERLQRREIDPGTIPAPFADRMADVLGISLAVCIRMLRGAPRLNVIIGEPRPLYGTRISFEQALRESESPDDGDYWLVTSAQALSLAEWERDGETEA